MSGISDLFNKARFKSEEIKSTFDDMESMSEISFDEFTAFESSLAAHYRQIEDLLKRIKDEKPDTRDLWIKRVQPMKDDYYRVKTDFTRFQSRRMQQLNRNQLLNRNASDLESNVSEQMNLLKENESLKRSTNLIDQYLEMGRGILSNLSDQGGILKSARTKILSMNNKLGLSSGILTKAGRRQKGDKYIVLGGMVFVILLLIVLYYYIKRK